MKEQPTEAFVPAMTAYLQPLLRDLYSVTGLISNCAIRRQSA